MREYTSFLFVPDLLGEQGVSDGRPGIPATAQFGALEDIIRRRLLLSGALGLIYRGTTFLSPHRHFIHVLPLKFLREAFIRRRTRRCRLRRRFVHVHYQQLALWASQSLNHTYIYFRTGRPRRADHV